MSSRARSRSRSRILTAAIGALILGALVGGPAAIAQAESPVGSPVGDAQQTENGGTGAEESGGEDSGAEDPGAAGSGAEESGGETDGTEAPVGEGSDESGSAGASDSDASSQQAAGRGATQGAAEAPSKADDEGGITATATALKASKAKADSGQKITLTATVSPTEATGTVSFSTEDEQLGGPVELRNGKASLETADLAVGIHSVTASFTPKDEAVYSASESEPVAITIIGKAGVSNATMKWGVRESFRSYIYTFDAFEGYSMMLGNTKEYATQTGSGSKPLPAYTEKQKRDISFANGKVSHMSEARQFYKDNYSTIDYRWTGGSGTAWTDGRKTNVSFGEGNGVHFLSHPMSVGKGSRTYALDLKFTNPRIELTSATKGVLYFDVKSRLFKSMNEVSNDFFTKDDVAFADLTLSAPTAKGNTLTWTDAEVTLREDGYLAFGGEGMSYPAGTSLDPLTFSLPLDAVASSLDPTKTSLKASASKVQVGQSVTLTASVSPKVDGSVSFSYGNTKIGKAVAVKNGKASISSSNIPVGIHRVTAAFTPKDSETYGGSFGSAQLTVLSGSDTSAPPGGNPSVTSGSGESAGSLSWGVSAKFISYTTCKNKEAYGMVHCATDGSIKSDGVGSGWLFPQSEGSSWNKESQTGTVQYSGSVVFNGYGQKMFQVVNPSITVTSPTSGTLHTNNDTPYGAESYPLDLSTATKTVGPGGAVTWSGVSVSGSLVSGGGNKDAITLEPLTFTAGAVNHASFASTTESKKKNSYTAAPTPPATTGIRVLTDPDKIRAGGRIEIEATGFDAEDNGVLVVLYSDPLVLDDTATADEEGVVHWSGTLPEDVKGQHTITLQGSKNAGAVIDIHEAKSKKSAKNAKSASSEELTAAALAEQQARSAGLFGHSNMQPWEWWASAGGLVVIAACTTFITARQRRP